MSGIEPGNVHAEDRRKHLDFIQAVVTRMSAASSGAKAWLLPVVTAAYGFALAQNSGSVALLGLAAVFLFSYLDAHYLRQERAYRELYDLVASGDPAVTPYSLATPVNRGMARSISGNATEGSIRQILRNWLPELRIWISWSIAPFYGALVLVGLGVIAYASAR